MTDGVSMRQRPKKEFHKPFRWPIAGTWYRMRVKSLTDLLAQSRGQISQDVSDPIAGQAATTTTSLPTENKQAPSATVQQRQDQFVQVQRLLEQKYPVAQIVRRVGISQRTLYRWLEHAEVPQGRHRVRRQSVIDTYKSYVRQRWAQGCQRGSQLYRELVAKGYRGSERAVYRYLAYLQTSASAPSARRGFS